MTFQHVRLAHLADPHLGIRQYHRQTPSGINQREADVAHAFRLAMDGVIAARPDAVVVAGDLFHSVRPTNSAIVFAFKQFQRLREALPDAPIVLIAGNHDTPRSAETGSILRLFEELGVDVAADEARRLEYPALDLSVLAVPHAALLSPERDLAAAGEPERAPGARRCTARSKGSSRPSGTRWSTAARWSDLRELGPRSGATSRSATTTSSTRWRRTPGTPARWSTSAPTSGASWPTRPSRARGARAGCSPISSAARSSARRGAARPAPIIDLEPVRGEGLDAPADRQADRTSGCAPSPAAWPTGSSGSRCTTCRATSPASWTTPRSAPTRPRRCTSTSTSAGRRSIAPSAWARPAGGRRCPSWCATISSRRPLPAELDRDAFVRLGAELMDAVERDLAGT